MNNQKNMQNQNITTSNMPKENPMIMFKQGDKIRATVIVYVDGVKMKQPELTNKTIILGADEFLPGFDKLLLNTKYSQNFILEFKADDKYEYEPFKGKNIKFEIIIHEHEPSEYKKCLDELEQTKKEIEQLKKELEQTKTNLNKKTNEHNQEIQNMNKTFKIKLLEVSKKAEDEVKEEKARTSKLFEEQKKEAKMYALQKFMEDFLSPYASLKMAILGGKKNENPVVKNFIIGFDMIVKQLENVFSDWNINLIYPTVGEQFDANTQQILEQVEDPNLPDHSIKMVHSIGFKLYDRLIKPALVVSVLNSNQETKQNDDKNINESKSLEEESSSSSSRVENEDKSSTNDFVNEQTTKEFRQEILKEQPPLSKKEQKKLAKEEKKRLKLQKKEEKKRLKLAKKEQKKLTKLAKKNKNAILNNKEKTAQENNMVVEQQSQQITDEKINENLNVSKTNEEQKKRSYFK
ncbi:nucleotide exchange factor GrpE [Mycoplasmopsis lipophila]|uniref:nucleotide exchange factor GrpE n=1 Tax=Mycoplasmopsis lipophila TaxID=2117 RepID=UPI0038730956